MEKNNINKLEQLPLTKKEEDIPIILDEEDKINIPLEEIEEGDEIELENLKEKKNTEQEQPHGNNIFGTSFNFINSILGAGILGNNHIFLLF